MWIFQLIFYSTEKFWISVKTLLLETEVSIRTTEVLMNKDQIKQTAPKFKPSEKQLFNLIRWMSRVVNAECEESISGGTSDRCSLYPAKEKK